MRERKIKYLFRNFTKVNAYSGFTIVEFILVVAIIGVIAVIALPRFPRTTFIRMRLKTTASQLVSDLRLTRTLAISRRKNFVLEFSGKSYAIYQESVSPSNQFGNGRQIANSINISGDTSFTFTPRGDLQTGSGTSISFSESGISVTITVIPATGMVSYSGV